MSIQRPRTGGKTCTIYGWVTAEIKKYLRAYARKHDISANYVMEYALRAYMLKGEPDCYPVGDREAELNLSCDKRLAEDVDRYCEYYRLTEREFMNYALAAFEWKSPPDMLVWRRVVAASKPLLIRSYAEM